jgi:hypothetical protein
MERAKTTPKDFFLWAGAMITLYASVVAFITLLFNYINYTFPDPLRYYTDPYSSGIPYQMATLIVLTPVFLILMRIIRKNIERDPSRAEIWVRRWALFLTVFAAGATIVGDLIILLTTFLSGEELTLAFLLKVLVVLLVAGAGFMHFMADLWGFWVQNPSRARMVNWSVGVLVVFAIVGGFFIVGTPQQAREYRLDQQRVNDLSSIQSQVVYYYQQKQKLPATLADLNDPLSYYSVPVDPQTGSTYTYQVNGVRSFELCAEFNTKSDGVSTKGRAVMMPVVPGTDDNWRHGPGGQCFSRTIDPERYPPITKPIQ